MIITAILRFLQICFAAIVLGLSISLIKGQVFGMVAAQNFAAFTGGWGMLAALLGMVAMFVEPLAGVVMAAIDGLAALFFLAGGIAIPVILRNVSCSSSSTANELKLLTNKLTNGGCIDTNKGSTADCGYSYHGSKTSAWVDWTQGRCKKNSADAAFMLISCVMCIGLAVMSLIALKRGSGRKGVLV